MHGTSVRKHILDRCAMAATALLFVYIDLGIVGPGSTGTSRDAVLPRQLTQVLLVFLRPPIQRYIRY